VVLMVGVNGVERRRPSASWRRSTKPQTRGKSHARGHDTFRAVRRSSSKCGAARRGRGRARKRRG
jgi:hypothetical protein